MSSTNIDEDAFVVAEALPAAYLPLDGTEDVNGTHVDLIGACAGAAYNTPDFSATALFPLWSNASALRESQSEYFRIDNIAHIIEKDGASPFTLEICFSTTRTGHADHVNQLMSRHLGTDNRMQVSITSTGEVDVRNTSSNQQLGSGYNDGESHHLLLTWPSSGVGELIVDGVSVSTNVLSTNRDGDRFSVGMEWDAGGPSDYFDGVVNGLMLHRRQVGVEEALRRYRVYSRATGEPYFSGTVNLSGATVQAYRNEILVGEATTVADGTYTIASWLLEPGEEHVLTCSYAGKASEIEDSALPIIP